MNCWIFPALVSSPALSILSAFQPPPWVSVRHPIVHDIQTQCENQQMGNFVCMVSVFVWECVFLSVYEEREGVRES